MPALSTLLTAYRRSLTGGLSLALIVLLTACSDHSTPAGPTALEALRQSAISFYQALYSASQLPVDTYVASTYINHQSSAGFTLTGLKAFALTRPSANSANRLIIHRTLVDGQLVSLHMEEPITADSSVAHMALLALTTVVKLLNTGNPSKGNPANGLMPIRCLMGRGSTTSQRLPNGDKTQP